MTLHKSVLSFVVVAVSLAAQATQASQQDDENAIRQVEAGWQDAWNRHDMNALVSLFADDADFVQVNGRRWVGTDEIKKNHLILHSMQFKESVWHNHATDVRFVAPDVAVVHQTWDLSGDKNPDGSLRDPRNGIFTQVIVKRDGKWLIIASQNTNFTVVPGSQVAGDQPVK